MAPNELKPVDKFYVERAVHHGEMTVYYVQQAKALTLTRPAHEFEMTWALNNAVIEAREAWHYAKRLQPEQVDAEIARQSGAREDVLF